MDHTLKISVSKKPVSSGIVSCRSISVRERFLRFLLGDKQHFTVIVPGDSVRELAISEVKEDPPQSQALTSGQRKCAVMCVVALRALPSSMSKRVSAYPVCL